MMVTAPVTGLRVSAGKPLLCSSSHYFPSDDRVGGLNINSIKSINSSSKVNVAKRVSVSNSNSDSYSNRLPRPIKALNAKIRLEEEGVGPTLARDRSQFFSTILTTRREGEYLRGRASRRLDFCANGDEEDEDKSGHEDEDEEDQLLLDSSAVMPERWDVLGLGQAMVDFSGMVDDEFLENLGLDKGTRKVVNHEERGKVLRAMDGCSYKAAAGGSLSNSLVALARLGGQPIGGPALSIGMAGSVGSDPLGGFYRSKLHRANVHFLSAPVNDGTTGTVIVLTTPDAQRTMLSYQGTSSAVNYDPCLAGILSQTNILVVEGYLFEFPDTIKTIMKACEEARRHGALIAITASDVSCIENHYDDFWEVIGEYADIVFANTDEARALCHFSSTESPICATRYLSHFVPLISVTDGPRGSYFGVKGEAIYIPPFPCIPVDTCGAGDAYASGVLYGIRRGISDLKEIGHLAARVASTVVGQQGTRLRVPDAVEIAESFAFHLKKSPFCSDVGATAE